MHFLEYYYKNVIKYDLINKFFYKNINELPEIKQIILNFGSTNTKIKTFAAALLALELITKKKGILTKTKKPNLFLKIQKGKPAGCKVTLKKKLMYNFLNKVLIEITPNMKNFIIFKTKSKDYTNFSFNLENKKLVFSEIKEHYHLSKTLSYLNITIITNAQTQKELFFLLRSFNLPLKSLSRKKQI
uniref:Ribosomal protein L5 n=1 Tax=Pleurosigma inscriptura TaxID=2819025 RepID=A0A8A3SPA1_9STRA|nr:ribosomal protein L5 [Pleurosigma inscriptura]QSZ78238.1 ribosomal protein L5 [Pleurosigma inscriptura]